ncbi:hypothetical protein [Brevundimonas sp. TWP3-1-2b1]|uniref:hypothetical protein n=1 Tax=Brevundimonas sp. TWP3-1-2b1 TaxID=2804650 RepID=UPI003CEFD42B
MEAPAFATSRTWPAPNPALAAAVMGSIMAGQGLCEVSDSQPWSAIERGTEFDRCAHWIADALKSASLTAAEVREGVVGGWFHLWSGKDVEGAMVSEIVASPRLRAIHVFAAGGTLGAVAKLTPDIERFARMAGCNFGGATGRKGWIRFLRRFGYAPAALTTVEKEL